MPVYEQVVASVIVQTVQAVTGSRSDIELAAKVAAAADGWRLQAAAGPMVPTGTTTPMTALGQQQLEVQRLGALRRFHVALANRRYAPVNIAVLGTSSTEGQGPTVYGRQYVNRVGAVLRQAAPTSGASGGENYVGSFATITGYTWPVTAGGGSISQLISGFGLRTSALTASGDQLTYSFTGTSAQIWYSQVTGAGTMNVTIDGVVVAAGVSTAGSTDRNAKWVSAALKPGAHTITVAWASGGQVYVHGIATFNGDENAGIRIFNGGRGALTSADFVTYDFQWYPRLATIQPHLVVLQLGVNDFRSNIPSATFKANLKSIIASIRANSTTNPSIVLASSPLHVAEDRAEPWENYRVAAHDVAAEDTGGYQNTSGVAVWDYALRWPSPIADNSLGLYQGDLLHMTDLGHSVLASQLGDFLLSGYEPEGLIYPSGLWQPEDHGLIGAVSADLPTQSTTIPNGNILLIGMRIRRPIASGTRTGYIHIQTAGATPTAGQCWACAVDSRGVQLSTPVDISGILTGGTGPQSISLGTWGVEKEGVVYLVLLSNCGTLPTLGRMTTLANANSLGSIGQGPTTYRWAFQGGFTTIPNPINMSANSPSSLVLWGALA